MKKMLNTLYIMTENAYLSLDGENIVFSVEKSEKARLPIHTLQNIVIFSRITISSYLMSKCNEMNISVSFIDPTGKYLASISGQMNGNVLLRRQQYRIADNELDCVKIAKNIIVSKVFNSRWVLERFLRDHPNNAKENEIINASRKLKESIDLIANCSNMDMLRGLEGEAAKNYFSVFDILILGDKTTFSFVERNRRPPKDPVNALLSFAYSILTNEVAAALTTVGLDSYVGFMHTDRPGRKSLALDLVEELRAPLADRFVLTSINLRIFKKSMFLMKEDGAVFLNEEGRKIFFHEWQKRKKEVITHPYLKEKVEWGMVPYVQAQLLARSIRSNDDYPPFLWK